MKLKKFITALSGSILLFSFNSVFAADITCPAPDKIRGLGSDFLYAYNLTNYTWVLVSDSFSWRDHDWQTLFTIDIPNVIEPNKALAIGQQTFNKSPLLTQPTFRLNSGDKTECSYAPSGANYQVIAATPISFGIKKS